MLLRELGLARKFIVQYAGNMGHPHDIETIAEVIRALRDAGNPLLSFSVQASNGRYGGPRGLRRLKNLTLLRSVREDQQTFLNACDVSIMALVPGMLGLGVPSRTYNLMAAGKPVIALVWGLRDREGGA